MTYEVVRPLNFVTPTYPGLQAVGMVLRSFLAAERTFKLGGLLYASANDVSVSEAAKTNFGRESSVISLLLSA
jgi:hypothetical protein